MGCTTRWACPDQQSIATGIESAVRLLYSDGITGWDQWGLRSVVKFGIVGAALWVIFGSYPTNLFAAEWLGYTIVDRPDGAKAHHLRLDAESERFCRMLNKAYFDGLKRDCPSCKLSLESCEREIPANFEKVVRNEVWAHPYVSQAKERTWFTGISLSESAWLCREVASQLRSAGYEAQCIE